MKCGSFIPALVAPNGGGGGGTVGPPGRDGKDGKDGRDGVDGKNGAVYVPHIDAHNVLTFTIEDEPVSVPDPVDLNPHDEWSNIDDSENETEYVWESL